MPTDNYDGCRGLVGLLSFFAFSVTLRYGITPVMATQRGRTKIHQSNADRQRAYRQRRESGTATLVELVEAVVSAVDRGRCHKIVKGLPEEPEAAARELIARLDGIALIKFPPRVVQVKE